MKKIYLLLLLATISLNLFCQQDNVIVIDSTYSYKWDTIINDWLVYWREVYVYDANGNRTEGIGYEWDSETNDWLEYHRFVQTYDTNRLQSDQFWYKWDSEMNDWDFWYYWPTEYNYDSNGNITEYNTWGPDFADRYVYTYDSIGNQTEQIWYKWDLEKKRFVANERFVYAYDANGNLTEIHEYGWDSENYDWVRSGRKDFTYSTDGNKAESIEYIWDKETNDWIIYSKTVYFRSELRTSISKNIIDLNYIVYPNPFTDYTTIKLSDAVHTQKIELIDIHGRILRTIDNVISNSVTIHRENLPSGIYFIRIHSDKTYVKKVIIR